MTVFRYSLWMVSRENLALSQPIQTILTSNCSSHLRSYLSHFPNSHIFTMNCDIFEWIKTYFTLSPPHATKSFLKAFSTLRTSCVFFPIFIKFTHQLLIILFFFINKMFTLFPPSFLDRFKPVMELCVFVSPSAWQWRTWLASRARSTVCIRNCRAPRIWSSGSTSGRTSTGEDFLYSDLTITIFLLFTTIIEINHWWHHI